jgi:hypothetical protein
LNDRRRGSPSPLFSTGTAKTESFAGLNLTVEKTSQNQTKKQGIGGN